MLRVKRLEGPNSDFSIATPAASAFLITARAVLYPRIDTFAVGMKAEPSRG